jgi:hypothetical protein
MLPQIERNMVETEGEEEWSSARSKQNNGILQRRGSNKGVVVTRFPVISPMSNGNINHQ